nr:hepatoma-derived growth factor-related protein 2-like [Aedes albopictus]
MSSRSVAGAGEHTRNKDDSPGGEGESCGTCRRVDNSRMVQCDECDIWFHYDCVNVNDSIRSRDWSCNGCVRTVLEKQRRALSEQLERFEQHQRQWQLEQQKRLEQMEERQRFEQRQTEVQQRKREQIVRMQLGELQLQQPSTLTEAVMAGLEVPPKSSGAIPKQHRQQVKVVEKPTSGGSKPDEQRNTEPLENSTDNNLKTSKTDKASSRSSRRSAKLRELEARALEARQALEKKQL